MTASQLAEERAAAVLDHVGLRVHRRDSAEDLLGRVLGLTVDAEGRFLAGGCGIELLAAGGRPAGIDHLALVVPDVETAAAALAGGTASPSPAHPGSCGLEVPAELAGGLPVTLAGRRPGVARGGPAADASAAARPPGLVEGIDHVGVASFDNTSSAERLRASLGMGTESTQTDIELLSSAEMFLSDTHGVVVTRRPDRIEGLHVTFLSAGSGDLELLQPISPHGGGGPVPSPHQGAGPGSTGRDKGAIGRFLSRSGPGPHHLALRVPDIDAALARLQACAVPCLDTEPRPGSRRSRIAFLHPDAMSGVLLHLVERDG